ncbi:iron/zinc/copper transport system ATP-binding protein [Salsuginibacillus halophilus]|uniref:Iron/zinc/copper transport system ATP-binding protein n=1 Tax=Salsuginibacillus halophilus TaxID=517424 RepID=A0A2P8HAH2_9BACI|nr:metal ABC transporter ATP-binding protein [Salsuginibacillus halophilus]PSL43225.1 iron/zinc/copper transport system ATP-binding protein [Salsuginibacillus halophilus]
MAPAVQVSNISVSYHGETALDDVSFTAEPSQLIGIIGPNGAGKSTLIKTIMGMIGRNEGEVEVLGQPISKVRKRVAYVPQRRSIDLDFPVRVEDVVVMGSYAHLAWWKRPGKKDKEKALTCLEKVGMLDFSHRQIGELSGGQQQRVFIARALMQDSDVLFLDEPFAGIDVASESIIIDLLRDLRNQGKTLFVVHHDLSKVETYFDTIMLLNQRLLGFGAKDEVFQPELVSRAYDGNVAVLGEGKEQVVVTS